MIWNIIFLVFAIVVYALIIICAHDDDDRFSTIDSEILTASIMI